MEASVAVVTGANKGIGLEVVRRLAGEGVTVVLTARDVDRGTAAVESLRTSGLPSVAFHQLDVRDPGSVASLADFLRFRWGKLDILVNNAAVSGVLVDAERLKALNIGPQSWLSGGATEAVQGIIGYTPETAEECLDTNYHGCKRVTEALIPLLRRSTSGARIVNVSSLRAELKRIPNENIRKELGIVDSLTEGKIDGVLGRFMEALKKGRLEGEGWSTMLPPYSISKAALNAYTRLVAKRHPGMRVNCVHPGYVDTDINWHTGDMTVEEGAKGPLMLALLPPHGPTGCYFDRMAVADF